MKEGILRTHLIILAPKKRLGELTPVALPIDSLPIELVI